ncbi:MAG: pyridoxal phosphate-dependent aminotransferase [Sulfitobacter sp.]
MKVKIHTLFQYLLDTTQADPEAFVGFSLAQSPKLGDFLADLDPEMSLDWNQKSFQGLPDLRQRVIDQAGLGGLCGADDVLITAGAAEANYLAFMQLVEPGDEVVTETPGWPQTQVLAKARQVRVKLVTRDETDGWALPLDQLEDAVTDKTRLIFLTNPNNPTGKLLTSKDLHRAAQIADKVGAWLIVDEVYAGLEWTADRAPSIAGIYQRGITTGSVSKALGLQGLRTGWLICRDKALVMDAVILRENCSEIMNVLGETIAEIALRPNRLSTALEKTRGDSRTVLEQLDRYITAEPNLSWHPPEAGLIGLARLPTGIDSDVFAKRLLADPYKTFLLPGSAYGLPNHIRVGVGGGVAANLDTGLARMSKLLAEWEHPTTGHALT